MFFFKIVFFNLDVTKLIFPNKIEKCLFLFSHLSTSRVLKYPSLNHWKQNSLKAINQSCSGKIIFLLSSLYNRCLSVCLFVTDKRQKGWVDRAKILCGTSHGPREGFWNIKIEERKILEKSWNFFWKCANSKITFVTQLLFHEV